MVAVDDHDRNCSVLVLAEIVLAALVGTKVDGESIAEIVGIVERVVRVLDVSTVALERPRPRLVMMIRLHNDDWGLETNCFVCEPSNPTGLQIGFFRDTELDVVTAEFELDDAFSGAPTLVHGGVTLAVLDEAKAWVCIAIGRQWAVTTETSTRFHRAVRVGSTYRVEAELVDHTGTTMRTAARVLDRRGQLRAEATASFTTLGEAQAARLAGAPIDDRHRQYVND
jgi:uncharacterized protein (TIGR00369 family)